MKKYKYNINNLDCANCAKRIENELNKKEEFNNVVVNFSQSTISYQSEKEISIKELNKIIKELEPDVTITNINEEKQTKEYHIYNLILGVLLGIIGCTIKTNNIIKETILISSYIILLYKTRRF